jgi:hypothetical protein
VNIKHLEGVYNHEFGEPHQTFERYIQPLKVNTIINQKVVNVPYLKVINNPFLCPELGVYN